MIRIAISGYGNLARGVEKAIKKNADTKLCAVFTRRDTASVKINTDGVPVLPFSEIQNHTGEYDVVINCGGSATDLPESTPYLSEFFNVVDSFDTHANAKTHFEKVDKIAREKGNVAVISVGWDPGAFSLTRLYSEAFLPDGESYTFWGRGVSQGHSDAIRRIDGVLDARQYTVPKEDALNAVRSGQTPYLSTSDKHRRECYVVAKEGADLARIEREIKTMPNYFSDYETSVTFITAEEMKAKHSELPHGGVVIRNGKTGEDTAQHIEYSLELGSNPEFTGSVLLSYARAAVKMKNSGESGCKTVFDVAPKYLSEKSDEELRSHLL